MKNKKTNRGVGGSGWRGVVRVDVNEEVKLFENASEVIVKI